MEIQIQFLFICKRTFKIWRKILQLIQMLLALVNSQLCAILRCCGYAHALRAWEEGSWKYFTLIYNGHYEPKIILRSLFQVTICLTRLSPSQRRGAAYRTQVRVLILLRHSHLKKGKHVRILKFLSNRGRVTIIHGDRHGVIGRPKKKGEF
jgi:hypothetical protein